MNLKPIRLLTAAVLCLSIGQAQAVSIDELKINGFFDMEYEKADKAPGDTKGSFDQYHLNLLFEFPVNDRITVKHHLEYEHVPQLEGGAGTGELVTEWSYLDYVYSNSIHLRAGFALTPFGIYNENHDATPSYKSARTPWGIYKTASTGASNAMFPKFTTGLFLLGRQDLADNELNYVFYLGNGENDSTKNPAQADDNTNKAIGTRISYGIGDSINLTVSYYSGKIGVARTEHDAWGFSAEYRAQPLELRAEYASAEVGNITQEGAYIEGAYTLGSTSPYLRYGMHDPDDTLGNDVWTETVVGIAHSLATNVILKVENRTIEGDINNNDVSSKYNEWALVLTTAF